VSVSYGAVHAVADVSFSVPRGSTVALIGPSGSGKSTLLRCLNRMNDLVLGCRVEGDVRYRGMDLYAPDVDPVAVRTRIGLVFQKPNPFPKSIFDNVAFGPRTHGFHGDLHDIVERALRRAALWVEVKDRLRASALALSGGQQQRLVIARALAVEPDILLMDEPASALDPISTSRIEDLMRELTPDVTIVIVTHKPPAGPPRSRLHRVPDLRARGRRRPRRPTRRVRYDREDLLPPGRRADRGLCQRPLRLSQSRAVGSSRARWTT
jgi:phosphate transport system ATP-binding protein